MTKAKKTTKKSAPKKSTPKRTVKSAPKEKATKKSEDKVDFDKAPAMEKVLEVEVLPKEEVKKTGLVILTGSDVNEPSVVEEKLTKEEEKKRERVVFLREQISSDFWELAMLMREVHDSKLFKKFGYKTWKSYIIGEVDFDVRKSEYLIKIVNWAESLPNGGESWIKSLGWTKAKELTKIVDPGNFSKWKEMTSGKSTSEIMDLVKGEKRKTNPSDSGSNDDGKEKAIRKAFQLFPKQFSNVEEALNKAKAICESEKDGNALDLIATSYLSETVDIKDIGSYLSTIEDALGVKLIALSKDAKFFLYGEDTADMIPEEL